MVIDPKEEVIPKLKGLILCIIHIKKCYICIIHKSYSLQLDSTAIRRRRFRQRDTHAQTKNKQTERRTNQNQAKDSPWGSFAIAHNKEQENVIGIGGDDGYQCIAEEQEALTTNNNDLHQTQIT